MDNKYKILFVEDSKVHQIAFKRFVRDNDLNYDFTIVGTVAQTKELLGQQKFDLLLVDYLLEDGNAFDIFAVEIETPIIIITGTKNAEIAVKAMKAGAYDYLLKDPDLNYLKILPIAIEKALQRRKSEEKEKLLSQALMHIQDSVCMTDDENKIIFVNQAFCEGYGYELEEIIGQNSRILWHEDTMGELFINLPEEISRVRVQGEFYHQRKDGTFFPVFLSHSIIEDKEKLLKVFVTNDITQRKVVEEKIRQLNENLERRTVELEAINQKLEAEIKAHQKTENSLQKALEETWELYNNAPCGYHSLDADATFEAINDIELGWLGYKREEAIGKLKFPDLLTPDSLATFEETFAIEKQRGWVREIEYQMVRKDGTILPVLLNGTAVVDENGNFVKSHVTVFDITERKRMEEALRESEERFRSAFDYAAIGMALVSKTGRWLQVNQALCEITGYSEAELLRTNFQAIAHPDDLEKNLVCMQQLLAGEIRSYQMEQRYWHKFGQVVWVVLSVSLVRDSKDSPLYFVAQIEDITQRKQVEAALEKERERLQLVAKATNDAVWDWDILTDRVWWGQGLQTMFGYDLEQVDPSFEFWLNRIHPEDRHRVIYNIEASVSTDKSYWSQEYRFCCVDDSWAYVLDRAYIIRNEKGQAIRTIGAMMDISDRRRTEEALRISQERYELAVCAGEVGVWDWNIETNEIYIDPNLKAALGYTDLDIKNQLEDWYKLVHPDDRSRVRAAIKAHLAGLTAQYEIEHRRLHKDSSIRWFLSRGTAFCDAEGKLSRMAGSDTDITKRKQAEEALESLSRQNESILNSAGEGIVGLDTEGKITFVNPAAARMTDYTVAELIGESFHKIMHHSKPDGSDCDWQTCSILAVFGDGVAHRATDEVFWRKDGSSFPVEYVSTPIKEASGYGSTGLDESMDSDTLPFPMPHAVVGAVVTFRDISDRLEVERMKDEFVSVVSHELRTPLTSMRGSLGLLLTGKLGELSDGGRRMLEIAVNNTDRLVRLINDILDLQRMASGQVQIFPQTCNAADLINQATEVMQAMADKAGVTLSVSTLSAQIWVDSDRLIQVLTNLLSNAIKFSPPGKTVWLSAEIQTRENDSKQILFQVKDQGRGIPADKLEAVFGRFQQVDASDSRAKGGTGLGLAICRSIVQQHQGKIWVESTLGQGSTFYVAIPLK